MTARENLKSDIGGFVILLRQQAELRYRNDVGEYESKRRVAVDGVVQAISRATDVILSPDYEAMPVEELKDAEMPYIKHLVKRTIANQRRRLESLSVNSTAAEACREAIRHWERALASL